MATINVADAKYRRLLRLASVFGTTPEVLLEGLIDELPDIEQLSPGEQQRRIFEFKSLAGAWTTPHLVDPRDIDEALADAMLDTHDDES